MFGPIFIREATVGPKRTKTYLARALYVLTLFLLLCTGYLVLDGARSLSGVNDSARFGGWMFSVLAPLQLLVLSAIAAVGAASSVAQEKDRRTLILLLLTRLSGFEIVAGKMASTLLMPLSLLLAALPLFCCLPLMGGVSPGQVLSVFAVTAATIVLASSVGTMMGLWREKTFQAIALTVLTLLLYVGVGEGIGRTGEKWAWLRTVLSPPAALGVASSPLASLSDQAALDVGLFVLFALLFSVVVTLYSIRQVRIWNPSREVRFKVAEAETSEEYFAGSSSAGQADSSDALAAAYNDKKSWKVRAPRPVWNNPVLWREMRTWAYGRKVVLIRVAFVVLFAVLASIVIWQVKTGVAYEPGGRLERAMPATTLPLAALGVISLVLVNALAVNSITGERDGLALDLLLVTDLKPYEFIFGKLLGVFYVAKELILLPIGLVIYLGTQEVMTWESVVYSVIGALVLYFFVTMLGIHSGLNYVASRTATLASLGTVFFLCVGIAVCMTIMVSFRGAFQYQLPPFLVMILGGGAALFASLGWRNPSTAILVSSLTLPLATFYAITQFLLQTDNLYVFFVTALGYSFTTAAMLVPALSDFDVSLGKDRRAGGEGA
jgi:ABC-type transport system involved in multi-copper enzyme maturation permease subunit